MPPKKTEAQKQADKAKKKQQLQLKRDLVKENKQKEFIAKYGKNRFINSVQFQVPKLVAYDKNGNFKAIDPLTKANNIKKINKKPVIKLVPTDKYYPMVFDDPKKTPEGFIKIDAYNKNQLLREVENKKYENMRKTFNEKIKKLKIKKSSDDYKKLESELESELKEIKSGQTKTFVSEPDLRLIRKEHNMFF